LEVLVVEDINCIRDFISRLVLKAGMNAVTFKNTADASNAIKTRKNVVAAILDLQLPDGYGGDLIAEIKHSHPNANIIVCSGSIYRKDLDNAIKNGAATLMAKPINSAKLSALLVATKNNYLLSNLSNSESASFSQINAVQIPGEIDSSESY